MENFAIEDAYGRKIAGMPPAMEALAIQCLVLIALGAALHLLSMAAGVTLSLAAAISLQSAGAAGLSYWRKLPWWWLPIQAGFPFALLFTYTLQLAPGWYLAGFLLLLGTYWSTFRTRVPFYPSGPEVWSMVESVLRQNAAVRFIDIGSGTGGAVLHLAWRRPESSFSGIELAPLPWIVSRLRALAHTGRPQFKRGDYMQIDLGAYDVVFAYLSTAAMPSLWSKAKAEMRSGSLLLSHEFSIPGARPDITCTAPGVPALYGWIM
jgi:hypothetical protein